MHIAHTPYIHSHEDDRGARIHWTTESRSRTARERRVCVWVCACVSCMYVREVVTFHFFGGPHRAYLFACAHDHRHRSRLESSFTLFHIFLRMWTSARTRGTTTQHERSSHKCYAHTCRRAVSVDDVRARQHASTCWYARSHTIHARTYRQQCARSTRADSALPMPTAERAAAVQWRTVLIEECRTYYYRVRKIQCNR